MAQAPANDDYASAFRLNQPGTALPRQGSGTFTNVDATEEAGEPNNCAGYNFGATVHFEAYPDRPGLLRVGISTPSFFGSLAIWRFTPDGGVNEGECTIVDLATHVADYTYSRAVQEGQGYNMQIGGVDADGGTLGPYGQGTFNLAWIFYPDTDRDGWLDVGDRCPDLGGKNVNSHEGCPDEDGDGFAEGPGGNDRCPGLTGRDVAKHTGCPDEDADGFPEGAGGNDRCPGKTGRNVSKHDGCPDNDRDRVPEDGSDECPGRNALKPGRGLSRNDRNGDGCPDALRLHGLVAVRKTITALPSAVQLNYLKVRGVPSGSRITCKIGRKACPRTPIRNSSVGDVLANASARTIKLLGSTRLGMGTRIEVRVTAKYATGKVYRLKVVPGSNGFGTIQEFEGCTNRGSRKVKAKGCR
jgi:hypothetical protein